MMYTIRYGITILTELLPISSSGHEYLYATLTHARQLPLMYTLSAHVVIATIICCYFAPLVWRWYYNTFSWRVLISVLFYSVLANSITLLIYLGGQSYLQTVPLWLGFSGTALLFWVFVVWQRYYTHLKNDTESESWLSVPKVLLLGSMQGLALIPGLSRLATTYCMSRWYGASHVAAFGFSWLLQLQLLAGAFMLDGYKWFIRGEALRPYSTLSFVCITLILIVFGYVILSGTAWLLRSKKSYVFAIYISGVAIFTWYFM